MTTRCARLAVCASLIMGAGLAVPAAAQKTTAEASAFRATSTYGDVLRFLDTLQSRTDDIRMGTLARSTEGRAIPWILAARPLIDDPAAAHRSGKPILYIQGNIHAGEVEGKEAALMLLRDLTVGALAPLLDSVILLVVPIYNADGNERFGPVAEHRPGQNGPERVGLRPNGQHLDLNRDYVKLEAPETRGAARLLAAWDPDIFVDLHTTNGSYHGYVLTYAPGLNPNDSPANDFLRRHFLPTIRTRLREGEGQETFWYGNFRNQHPDSLDRGWYTYDPRPRFGTNWFAMRGRMAILSEGYSNAPFEVRVSATYNFVREIIRLAAEDTHEIASLQQAVEEWRPDHVSVRARRAPPDTLEVIAEITESVGAGAGPFARRRRTGEYRTVVMPVFGRFEPAERVPMPHAYLLPPRLYRVVTLLLRQGVRVERLTQSWQGPAETFAVDSVHAAPRAFQGHRTVSLAGRWAEEAHSVGAGWFLVPTDQRLGVLAAYLLEPRSADGVATWNFLDRDLAAGRAYPILRVHHPLRLTTVVVRGGDVPPSTEIDPHAATR